MSPRRVPSLFDRLRRATPLRALLVVSTLLASQGSLACAFEALLDSQGIEQVAQSGAAGSDECCALCPDCAGAGACHASAVAPRGASRQATALLLVHVKFTFSTAAPALWVPPALLRPPIGAA